MARRPAIWPGVLAVLAIVGVAATGKFGTIHQLTNIIQTSKTSKTTYAFKRVTLDDGSKTIARWNPCQRAITYKVNVSGLPAAKRAAALKEVKTGVAKLAQADGMKYHFKGTTRFIPTKTEAAKEPAEIVIAIVGRTDTDITMADSTLGYGGVVWTTWSGAHGDGAAVVRGFVIMNADSFSQLTPGFGSGNSDGNLLLHELGHATGLEHVQSSDQIMYPTLSDKSGAGYQKGDLTGLTKVGAKAGCIKIPRGAGLPDQS